MTNFTFKMHPHQAVAWYWLSVTVCLYKPSCSELFSAAADSVRSSSQRYWSCLVQRWTNVHSSSTVLTGSTCSYVYMDIHSLLFMCWREPHSLLCSIYVLTWTEFNRDIHPLTFIIINVRVYVKLSVCLHGCCSCVYMNLVRQVLTWLLHRCQVLTLISAVIRC